MKDKDRNYRKLLLIGFALVLIGSLLGHWILTGAGTISVKEVKIYGAYDGLYSAHLYIPNGVITGNPAPGILTTHGFNNDKEYMANTAIELARRGYVVLAMDLDKHGMSAASQTPSANDNAYGAADALKYLRSLDIVDPDNIGLIGMSMGGMAIEGAAQMMPDQYQAMFFMDSSCSSCEKDRNVAVSWGLGSEVPQPWGAMNGSEVQSMPEAMKFYGTDQPIVDGKVYGSIEDGTGKVLYTHFGNHPYSTDDPTSIGNAVRWFNMTLSGSTLKDIAAENQIWQYKVLGTGLAFVGLIIFMIGLGAYLLTTPLFASLNQSMPVYKGNTGLRWWIFAVLTAFVGPLTLYDLFLSFFMANPLKLEGVTSGFVGWIMVVGLITIVILVAAYFVFGKKEGVSLANYGLADEKSSIHWAQIGKSLLLALAVTVSGYVVLYVAHSIFMVDFRFWLLTLKVTDWSHFLIMFPYIIPTAIYFVPIAVVLHGTLRPQNGNISFAKEALINTGILLLGLGVVLAYYYIPLEFFGAPAAFGPGGLGLINAIGLLALEPVIAVISTYFFRKTGRIYVGAFINTLFIVWYLVATNTIYSFGG
jgi:uncharacterized protein